MVLYCVENKVQPQSDDGQEQDVSPATDYEDAALLMVIFTIGRLVSLHHLMVPKCLFG